MYDVQEKSLSCELRPCIYEHLSPVKYQSPSILFYPIESIDPRYRQLSAHTPAPRECRRAGVITSEPSSLLCLYVPF